MGGRAVAAFAAALGSIVCVAPLAAADSATLLLFSGVDAWRQGAFMHGGLLYAPDGFDRDGIAVRVLASGGQYRYLSGALGNAPVKGEESVFQFMPGWRWHFGRSEFKMFAGVDLQHHTLRPDDPSSGLRGTQSGVRVAFEFWTEPSPGTMIAADGSVSTLANSYVLRGATGFRIFDRFYIGPEIQTFSSGTYSQFRAGLHFTGLRTRWVEWSAGFGYAHDDNRRSGVYGRLGVLVRR